MAQETVLLRIRKYLEALPSYGVHARRAVLFGSFAKDAADEWSDIDLVVIAPEFDGPHQIDLVKGLWRATLAADKRIEPIPCGEREWDSDSGGNPIIEIARREGVIVTV
jgi:predicted nucleotidyltransferase